MRRSLALDAFADAEDIQADEDDQEYGRQRKAIARLIEVATADGLNGASKSATDVLDEGDGTTSTEMAAQPAETSDTESQSDEAAAAAEEV